MERLGDHPHIVGIYDMGEKQSFIPQITGHMAQHLKGTPVGFVQVLKECF
jgi:hypothetical protein